MKINQSVYDVCGHCNISTRLSPTIFARKKAKGEICKHCQNRGLPAIPNNELSAIDLPTDRNSTKITESIFINVHL